MLVVCLPTYDERENLERMARASRRPSEHGLDGRVLVIDDASPDGTGELADRLAAELGNLDVLHRARKEGWGLPTSPASRRRSPRAPIAWPPWTATSRTTRATSRGSSGLRIGGDRLGSRYVRGGGTRNWGLVRRAVSRGGSLYARAILGIPVRDATSGFKVYRRDVLEAIDPERIESRGYAFQVEMVYRTLRTGFAVEEVPILFADREEGGSKMGPGIVLEAMIRVPALRLAAARRRL